MYKVEMRTYKSKWLRFVFLFHHGAHHALAGAYIANQSVENGVVCSGAIRGYRANSRLPGRLSWAA